MGEYLQEAVLPVQYDNYVFDLYGTLVDIHTEEDFPKLWEKLALFFGYYGAIYKPKELQKRYAALVSDCERALKKTLEEDITTLLSFTSVFLSVSAFGAVSCFGAGSDFP